MTPILTEGHTKYRDGIQRRAAHWIKSDYRYNSMSVHTHAYIYVQTHAYRGGGSDFTLVRQNLWILLNVWKK